MCINTADVVKTEKPLVGTNLPYCHSNCDLPGSLLHKVTRDWLFSCRALLLWLSMACNGFFLEWISLMLCLKGGEMMRKGHQLLLMLPLTSLRT